MPFKKILFLGVAAMVLYAGGCSSQLRYQRYSSKDTQLNLQMDYLHGWTFKEERGSYGSYAQVIFLEPARKDKPIRASIAVMVKRESKTGWETVTLEAFVEDLRRRRLKMPQSSAAGESQTQFFGLETKISDFLYSLPENPRRPALNPVSMRERIVVFKWEDRFYVLRYVNTLKEFKRFEEAFLRSVRSLTFK